MQKRETDANGRRPLLRGETGLWRLEVTLIDLEGWTAVSLIEKS